MKKQIKLFFDMEFSSLSPDAQIISLGIVSEKMSAFTNDELELIEDHFKSNPKQRFPDFPGEFSERLKIFNATKEYELKTALDYLNIKPRDRTPLEFYAEFNDFDINRCSDWVKENVIKNLSLNDHERFLHHHNNLKRVKDDTRVIKKSLSNWLELFKDYEITFVADCGCFDWYHLLQLIAEWETLPNKNDNYAKWCVATNHYKTGLPKLPENISPVPLDLNDLIAHEKGISVREAFDMDRKWLVNDCTLKSEISTVWAMDMVNYDKHNHNSLFDSKIIKAIYEKLIR